MTDPKYPALLAAERWFATKQAVNNLSNSARCLVNGWAEDTLRCLARIAFVAGSLAVMTRTCPTDTRSQSPAYFL